LNRDAACVDCRLGGAAEPGSDGGRMTFYGEATGPVWHGDHPSHKTVAVLTAFATAVTSLHRAIEAARNPYQPDVVGRQAEQYAAEWARSAVRAARCLAVREEYR